MLPWFIQVQNLCWGGVTKGHVQEGFLTQGHDFQTTWWKEARYQEGRQHSYCLGAVLQRYMKFGFWETKWQNSHWCEWSQNLILMSLGSLARSFSSVFDPSKPVDWKLKPDCSRILHFCKQRINEMNIKVRQYLFQIFFILFLQEHNRAWLCNSSCDTNFIL